jgi:alanyl aminopeptidase
MSATLLGAPVPIPTFRLPDGARPLACAVDLTLTPDQEAYKGSVEIDIRLVRPAEVIWLNATGLTILDAAYHPRGAAAVAAKARMEGTDFLELALAKQAPAGRGVLRIHFTGSLTTKDTRGLFVEHADGNGYIFSQFQPTSARQAFPCFDEPGFKVPWRMTLRVPQNLVAVSNAPMASEEVGEAGLKTVRFAPTQPLPSYLVALGVGPFDYVDAGKAGRRHTPLRILVPKGHKAEAAYAARTMPELFTRLETYFGLPFPYEKLDSLVVPEFPVCMENAGLITYAQNILLSPPGQETTRFKRLCATTMVHEMAHHWFGDMVTMAWWNDVWLNEGFASWMEGKIVQAWQPGWDDELERQKDRARVMDLDTLLSARRICEPIGTPDAIENAFDDITYTKGCNALSTGEAFLGPEKFRQGVHRYLAAHRHGSATTKDFLGSLGDSRLPDALRTFLDQPGLPLVSVSLKPGTGTLLLKQSRFLSLGTKDPAPRAWRIPLVLRYGAGARTGRIRLILEGPSQEVKLPIAARDLDYLLVNDGMAGYYRVGYSADLRDRLMKAEARLSTVNRIGMLNDLQGAVKAGTLAKGEVLALAPRYAAEKDLNLITAAVSMAGGLAAPLLREEFRPRYARFLQGSFGERARALGFKAAPGEPEAARNLRVTLVGLMASAGEDAGFRAQAREWANLWLVDQNALDPDLQELALPIASRYGDRALFDRFLALARTTQDHSVREQMINCMAAFQSPELARAAREEFLTDHFDPRAAIILLFAGVSRPDTRSEAFAFLKEHYDAITNRLPPEMAVYFINFGIRFSDAEDRAAFESFFKDRVAKLPGGPLMLRQMLETMQIREEQVRAQRPSVEAFLAGY